MYDRETDDTLAYLAPLARQVSRDVEFRMRFQPGELYTQALIGAWEAVISYDAKVNDSLWRWASMLIRYRTYDQARVEIGRNMQRSAAQIIPVSHEDLRNVACFEHGYDDVETENFVQSILERLSPKHREILKVIYFNETSLNDIATRLRISESAACRAAKKARRRARLAACELCGGAAMLPAPRDSSMLIADGAPVSLAPPAN